MAPEEEKSTFPGSEARGSHPVDPKYLTHKTGQKAMERYSNPVFQKHYHNYLQQLQGKDLSLTGPKLGCRVEKGKMQIPFLGRCYCLDGQGIADPTGARPIYPLCVVLLKYVLLCPAEVPPEPEHYPPDQPQWLAFRSFKDAAPFAAAFSNNVELALARKFGNKPEKLEKSCLHLQGLEKHADNYDLCFQFQALPKVRTLLLFNQADEEFPANCSLLFSAQADRFLDMESLAITGWLLADYLRLAAGETQMTIM